MLRPPRQARSRRTLQAILDATLALLEERGVEGTTVHAVVERAGTSVGSFYARFSGKDDLLRYLEFQVWSDARERWDEAMAAQTGEGASRLITDVVAGLVAALSEGERGRAGERHALGSERGVGETDHPAEAFDAHRLECVRSRLLDLRAAINHPEPEAAVLLGYRAVVGALRESAARGDGLSDALLESELTRLYVAYLGVDASGVGDPDSGGRVEFFDVWA